MEKINFVDGQLVSPASVNIEGEIYPVQEAEYEGTTPLSAFMLNKMQDNIEEAIQEVSDTVVTETATTTQNGLMSKEDKAKLDNISNATTEKDGLLSKEDKAKLNNTLEFEEIEEFEFEDEE